MDPFKNFATNLNAPGRGPITVLIAWMFVVAALGIFGHGDVADYAMGISERFELYSDSDIFLVSHVAGCRTVKRKSQLGCPQSAE
jgi:hypothetical protein